MIDAWTHPGTKIVCIDAGGNPHIKSPLKIDAVYTLARWDSAERFELDEFPPGLPFAGIVCCFNRRLFRRADLPDALTTLLLTAPTPTRELEPA